MHLECISKACIHYLSWLLIVKVHCYWLFLCLLHWFTNIWERADSLGFEKGLPVWINYEQSIQRTCVRERYCFWLGHPALYNDATGLRSYSSFSVLLKFMNMTSDPKKMTTLIVNSAQCVRRSAWLRAEPYSLLIASIGLLAVRWLRDKVRWLSPCQLAGPIRQVI